MSVVAPALVAKPYGHGPFSPRKAIWGKSKKYPPDPFEADKRRERRRAKKMRKLGKPYIPRRTWE